MNKKDYIGSVYKDKKANSWVAEYKAIDPNTGIQKKRRKYFKSQIDAENHLKCINLQQNNSLFFETNGIELISLMKVLLNKKYDSNLISDRGYARTNDTLKSIEKVYLSNKKINEISSEELQEYFNTLITKYSNSSIQKIYYQFKQAFEYALNKGFITTNPMCDTIKPKSKKVDKQYNSLELEEQQLLTHYLITQDISSFPYKNSLLFELYMGLRIGEVLALTTNDIDLENKTISVNKTLTTDKDDKVIVGSQTKTYAGMRKIPIPESIYPYVLEQIDYAKKHRHCENRLFLTPEKNLVNHSTINRKLKEICKVLGISVISTHNLRHTYGTRCIESGMRAVALQRLMGHTDINITLNTYTSILDKYKQEEMSKVNDYYSKNDMFNTQNKLLDTDYKILDNDELEL